MARHSTSNPFLPLSEQEMGELDRFLMSDATSYDTMSIDTLDGYLTAVAIGPIMLDFKQWFPGIWGPDEEDEPDFDSAEQAQHIIGLIVRQMNGIISAFEADPDEVEPIFVAVTHQGDPREYTDAEMWAYGFMQGLELCRKDWQPFFDDPESISVLRPLHLLGSDEVTAEEEAYTETPEQSEELAEQVPDSLAWIYRFWLPYRQAVIARGGNTIQRQDTHSGGNDLCPCGSLKKFNVCCGTPTTLH